MSHLVEDPRNISFAEVRNIASVELVNKTFQSRCWRVIKQLLFYVEEDGEIMEPEWLPSDTADVMRIVKKFRNLRKLFVFSYEVGGETTNNFLSGILELQREDMRNIQSLDFVGAAVVSPLFPRMIELCSTSLTSLSFCWDNLELNDNGSAVGPIARAVGLCRNLKRFKSTGSPNGIGLVFKELSDKAKLEEINLNVADNDDLPAEMPELVKCLSALQSAELSTNSIALYLATLRELAAFLDAGKSIEWNTVTSLGGFRGHCCTGIGGQTE